MSAPPPPVKPSVKKGPMATKDGIVILKKGSFAMKDGVMTCNGFELVDSARLEKLFHPEKAGGTPRTQRKYAAEAKKLFSKSFFGSQLRFYGITFPRSATEAQLSSLLDKAVLAKQCLNVPPSVAKLQWDLKVEHDRAVEEWKKAADNWDSVWKQRQEEEWAQLETPTDRAGHDLTRFMEHYFLTEGVPDPAKKPEPLALFNFTDENVVAELCERAAQVPNLEVASAGTGPDRAICIGWDRTSVLSLAGEIQNVARENQKKRLEAEWEKAMLTHRQFASDTTVQTPPVATTSSTIDTTETALAALAESPAATPVALQDTNTYPKMISLRLASGSFVLQCKAVTDTYQDLPNIGQLALDIAGSPANNVETLRANVELGAFQGTAILSFSQDILDWFVRRFDKTASASMTKIYSAKREYAKNREFGSNAKRKCSVPEEEERPSKQRKVEEPKAGRIYLRMRGRQALNDEACRDVQHGYLDFLDGNWSKFKGCFDIPGVGEDVEVEGFRVKRQHAVEPPPWEAFWPST